VNPVPFENSSLVLGGRAQTEIYATLAAVVLRYISSLHLGVDSSQVPRLRALLQPMACMGKVDGICSRD
jgi:hypothetical protein